MTLEQSLQVILKKEKLTREEIKKVLPKILLIIERVQVYKDNKAIITK